jgi:glycosyltransferase involved in cell wall biosynthesis
MSRILMLTPQVPYPPSQGTALRNWGILRGLAAEHRLDLLSFVDPDQPQLLPREVLERVGRGATVEQPPRSTRDRLRHLFTSLRPDLTLRLQSAAFAETLEAWLDENLYDWILVEGLELAPYLEPVWQRERAPRVAFDDHNCEYVLQRRAFVTDLGKPKRWPGAAYSLAQWRRLRRYEGRIVRRSDLVVAVSEPDADALRRLAPGLEPLVVPNGIDVSEYAGFKRREPLEQPAFIFTGTMDFRPNVDGVLWFVREVWPRVLAALPRAHFYVVGKRPHERLEPLRELPNVHIIGAVPDTRPYIKGALVYVVPLWVGGGTRFKILEAASMEKPIISTSLGAEGFPEAEEALYLEDDAVTFANACVKLAEEPALRADLMERGRAFAERYNWSTILPPLIERLAVEREIRDQEVRK